MFCFPLLLLFSIWVWFSVTHLRRGRHSLPPSSHWKRSLRSVFFGQVGLPLCPLAPSFHAGLFNSSRSFRPPLLRYTLGLLPSLSHPKRAPPPFLTPSFYTKTVSHSYLSIRALIGLSLPPPQCFYISSPISPLPPDIECQALSLHRFLSNSPGPNSSPKVSLYRVTAFFIAIPLPILPFKRAFFPLHFSSFFAAIWREATGPPHFLFQSSAEGTFLHAGPNLTAEASASF